jgi:hypothetical protein
MNELKIYFQNTTKIFLFPSTYEDLCETVTNSFNLSRENIHFHFIDEDADKIVISNDFDFRHVIQILTKANKSTLKLHLEHTPDHSKIESISMTNSLFPDKHLEDLYDNESKLKLRHNIKQEIETYINNLKVNLTNAIDNKIFNTVKIDDKKCNHCKNNLENNALRCLLCNDLPYCKDCENILDVQNHILLKIMNPDTSHLDALTKRKESSVFNKNNLIAFNSFTDKYVIEINNGDISNYMNFTLYLKNFCKYDIISGDSVECIFDESDIFGNKYVFSDNFEINCEFSIDIMFYNFANKPPGYYLSKWVFNLQMNRSCKYFIQVIFRIQYEEEEFSFKAVRKGSTNSERVKSAQMLFPDLYSEIIKKHENKEK